MGNTRITELNESDTLELEQIDHLRHDPTVMSEIRSLEESAKTELELSRVKQSTEEGDVRE